MKEWFLIANPASGSFKCKKDWPKIAEILTKNGINYRKNFTKRRADAISMAKKAVNNGFRKFIAVGGDGTINEIVNGLFLQSKVKTTDIILGVIPVGTANDWGRTIGIPHGYESAVKALKKGKTFIQDTCKVTYAGNDGNRHERYLVNMAGMGFDAEVAEKTNRDKKNGKSGQMLYFYNIFTTLFSYKYTDVKIKVDDRELYSGTILSMNTGICQFNGGGMMQLPKAVPDDGLIDMTIIKKLGKLSLLLNVKNLYDGSFINHPKVETFQGKKIVVESDPPVKLEADGESLGGSPLTFEVCPKTIKVIID